MFAYIALGLVLNAINSSKVSEKKLSNSQREGRENSIARTADLYLAD